MAVMLAHSDPQGTDGYAHVYLLCSALALALRPSVAAHHACAASPASGPPPRHALNTPQQEEER